MAPSTHALVAHVLRRLSFGPHPDQLERFAALGQRGPGEALDWALDAPAQPARPERVASDDWDANLFGWVENLRRPDAGLHEKMTWFWHGHFATSSDKVGNQTLLHAQQRRLREHALGSFRDLLRAVMKDPAMMLYLDAAGSGVEAPNENLARESMELFALGRGAYTEADVKAGALALAGWDVDYDTGAVTFDAERALGGEVVYLGRRGRFDVDDIVDILCDQPSCAPYIASRVHQFLAGTRPDNRRLAVLAERFRSSGLSIRALVEEIVRAPEFLDVRLNRPRFAIEWWTAALAAIGPFREDEDTDVWPWTLQQLDQLPYRPPNVAGWAPGVRWLSASQQVTRAAYVWNLSWRMRPIEPDGGTDLVRSTLRRCSLHEVSAATRGTLRQAALATAGAADALSVSRRLITAALCSPEFALA